MKKLLIFIVAYNAEKHIKKVLDRIPRMLFTKYECEVLIIDDNSKDQTFEEASLYINSNNEMNIKVLYNPINQGYGGNQKLGYRYAIKHNFDYVVLLHGDGQYAPEIIDEMIEPLASSNKDFVIGSRMINKNEALKGGMPYYKFVGNIILTKIQNYLLKSDLKEFHSGYRSYSIEALKRIPFEQNSNDYNFDTQIIIQSLLADFKIVEIPIPTYYGDEICHVNGVKYGLQILKDSLDSRLHALNIFYKKIYQQFYRPI
jgi:glycosyltransferase involved in cell wall biosynthesis